MNYHKVGLCLFVKLPQDLLAIWSKGDILTPCAVQFWAVGIEDGYGILQERDGYSAALVNINITSCGGCVCEEDGFNPVDRLLRRCKYDLAPLYRTHPSEVLNTVR